MNSRRSAARGGEGQQGDGSDAAHHDEEALLDEIGRQAEEQVCVMCLCVCLCVCVRVCVCAHQDEEALLDEIGRQAEEQVCVCMCVRVCMYV